MAVAEQRPIFPEAMKVPDAPALLVEREHLAMADRHIAEGECRVTAQALLVEQLGTNAYAIGTARDLLLALQQTLDTWNIHRSAILREIARLEGAGPPFRT